MIEQIKLIYKLKDLNIFLIMNPEKNVLLILHQVLKNIIKLL